MIILKPEEIQTELAGETQVRRLNLIADHINDKNPNNDDAQQIANMLGDAAQQIRLLHEHNDRLNADIDNLERDQWKYVNEQTVWEEIAQKVNLYNRSLKDIVQDKCNEFQLILK